MAHPPIILEHWLALGYFRGITTTTAKRHPVIAANLFAVLLRVAFAL